jgi:hypothetical protein
VRHIRRLRLMRSLHLQKKRRKPKSALASSELTARHCVSRFEA